MILQSLYYILNVRFTFFLSTFLFSRPITLCRVRCACSFCVWLLVIEPKVFCVVFFCSFDVQCVLCSPFKIVVHGETKVMICFCEGTFHAKNRAWSEITRCLYKKKDKKKYTSIQLCFHVQKHDICILIGGCSLIGSGFWDLLLSGNVLPNAKLSLFNCLAPVGVHMCVYLCVFLGMCVCACTRARVCTCMCVCMRASECACVSTGCACVGLNESL